MDWLSTIFISFVSALAFLSLVFLFGAVKRRFDIVDTAWGPTFVVIAAVNLALASSMQWQQLLVFALVVVWAGRLAWHIGRRFMRSAGEDPRYTELRSKWPQKYLDAQVYLWIYLTQAVLACAVSAPVIIIMNVRNLRPAMLVIGLVVWLAGFAFEVVGDRQLRHFLAEPSNRGKLMTSGLWRYSRHPNYFGEITLWWGIGIMAFGTGYGEVGLIGPLTITMLILFVSGVPPAERRSSKKSGWDAYRTKTSVLIPLPPK